MNDLISRQAAIDWLKNEWDGMVTSVFKGIENLPSAQPTADVVEVVRCKDCRFYTFKPQQTSRTTSVRRCNRSAIVCTKPDDYCSFGERESENDREI